MEYYSAIKNEDIKEIRETTHFTIVTNNIKYLGVILTKEVKDLCYIHSSSDLLDRLRNF